MSSLTFVVDPRSVLVADASVIINLNATLCAAEILRALQSRVVVTENAVAELVAGARNGHHDAVGLDALVKAGLVHYVQLGPKGTSIYESLIDGSTLSTLDDGEAATIGYAVETSGVALIDERKAKRLCRKEFPATLVMTTVELLMHDPVTEALGHEGRADALMNALTGARMRVPPEHISWVTSIIGEERAATCVSLPRSARG